MHIYTLFRTIVLTFITMLFCTHQTCYAVGMQQTGMKAPVPYTRFELPIECLKIVKPLLPVNPIIIDCGAYDGAESKVMAKMWPKGSIHSFEPVDNVYERLVENIANVPNITSHHLALGDESKKAIMYLSTEKGWQNKVSMSSSLLPPKEHLKYSDTLFKEQQIVNVTTIDDWAADNNIDHVDMLWLDMQGAELQALKASPNILSTVSVILTEIEFVEAYEGQPLYREIKAWLEKEGFQLIGGNFSFPKHKKQWFGDGLFVRKELLR